MSEFCALRARPRRILFGPADPAVQGGCTHTPHLERWLKAMVLQGHEVLIPAPFFWQSEETRKSLSRLAPLLESTQIGLLGRPGVTAASDYLSERESDTLPVAALGLPPSSPFASEVPNPFALTHAREIDRLTHLIPRRGSVERHFKRLFSRDLDLTGTAGTVTSRILRECPVAFSVTGRNHAESIINRLALVLQATHFSRASVEAAACERHAHPELLVSLNVRSSGLYQAANALASDAELFTFSEIAEAVPSEVAAIHQYSLSDANPHLFLRVLGVFGVTPEVIDRLPLSKVQELARSAPELAAFVAWYARFIESVAGGDGESLLGQLTHLREATRNAAQTLTYLAFLERWKASWLINGLTTLVGVKLGFDVRNAASVGGITKAAADGVLGFIRDRCERAMVKPLDDFDALVLREGLRGALAA